MNRKAWNEGQKELRLALSDPATHAEAIQLFQRQHAVLHAAQLDPDEAESYVDEILADITEPGLRRIPKNCEHSIAWLLWHMARIEDVAMNILVAGRPQVLQQADWLARMKVKVHNTGNAMGEAEVAGLSARIDIAALRAYRLAVGRETREIVTQLSPQELKKKVDPARLQQILEEGYVLPAAQGLLDYWGRRDIAGLLLMPPTRHNFVHLNEAQRLKKRRR